MVFGCGVLFILGVEIGCVCVIVIGVCMGINIYK